MYITEEEAAEKECPIANMSAGIILAIMMADPAIMMADPMNEKVAKAFNKSCVCRGSLCAWWDKSATNNSGRCAIHK